MYQVLSERCNGGGLGRLHGKKDSSPDLFQKYFDGKLKAIDLEQTLLSASATNLTSKSEIHFMLALLNISEGKQSEVERHLKWLCDEGEPNSMEKFAAPLMIANAHKVSDGSPEINIHPRHTKNIYLNLQPELTPISTAEANKIANQVAELISTKFYNAETGISVSQSVRAELLNKIAAGHFVLDMSSFSFVLNEELKRLDSSHCQFVTTNDEAFYFLHSLFATLRNPGNQSKNKSERDPLAAPVACTGFVTGGCGFDENVIRYVLDDSPAAKAGLQIGDRIRTVNGHYYQGYLDFVGRAGQQLNLVVDRQDKEIVEIAIKPIEKEIYPSYVEALRASQKKIDSNGHKFGYVHLWAGGTPSAEALHEVIADNMGDVDGLILDLRDGYGGASLQDLDMFYRKPAAFPDLVSKTRDGKTGSDRLYFDKPVVVLINSGSRSGKELLAYSLKNSGRAVLVGEKTAGAVVAGRLFPIDKRCSLYLAVADVELRELKNGAKDPVSVRLEGKGVTPDIEVLNESHNQDGYGLQLKAAIEALEKQLRGQN